MSAELLGDLVETLKGYAFKSDWYEVEGTPIVKVSDFTADSIDVTSCSRISEHLADTHRRYRLHEGDVILQTVGSWPSNPASVVGKCVRVPRSAEGSLLNQNAVRIIPRERLDNGFLFYLLRSPSFQSYIVGNARGSASQASITLEAIKSYTFTVPDLEVQRQIAQDLFSLDHQISINRRRIELLEDSARLIFREWFIQLRFPGHDHAQREGDLPTGWKRIPLGEIVAIRKGKNITKQTIVDGDVPVVAGGLQPAGHLVEEILVKELDRGGVH